MRIDAYNQIAQLYQTGKSIRTNKANSTASVRDEVQISQTARDYQIAKQAVAGASDVREDKVAYNTGELLGSGGFDAKQ